MKIGLLGGTFNPIHNCHLSIAEETRKRLSLDRVIFIPSHIPPHKIDQEVIAARHRYEMVRLAIQPYPAFEVSDLEIKRPGPSYSVDTVQSLRGLLGVKTEIFFILGLDAFLSIGSWKSTGTLLTLCAFVVISRPGSRCSDLARLSWCQHLDRKMLSSLDRGDLDQGVGTLSSGTAIHLLRLPPCEISSTGIVERLKAKKDVKNLLPASVESYIMAHSLYR
ncbi:MAG TPA: nicotinate-nucleotide adenylyltransferase [Nitrospiria bacterium]|jgi:nicotinate-nucleotide adenylyltransferase|nr:nicotinate-nucleotide adenylyltransferase [Nitrospiria bacterium]